MIDFELRERLIRDWNNIGKIAESGNILRAIYELDSFIKNTKRIYDIDVVALMESITGDKMKF